MTEARKEREGRKEALPFATFASFCSNLPPQSFKQKHAKNAKAEKHDKRPVPLSCPSVMSLCHVMKGLSHCDGPSVMFEPRPDQALPPRR